MYDFVVKSLGVVLVLTLATSGATGDRSPIADSPISQPLGDADLVCSATLLGTWRTGDGVNPSSSGASGRAEVDRVFKGKLIRTRITFRDGRWRLPDDLDDGPGVETNSITLTPELRPGIRYMLFLSSDSANGHTQAAPTYKLDFSVSLAPSRDTQLRLDASKMNSGEQEREIVEEFVRSASFVLDSHGNAADAYDYFSYVYELLGIDAMSFIQELLESADTRLRYFAADKLAQMNDESAVDSLLLVLNDPNLDAWMRVSAAWDLGMLGATKVLPDFERLATGDPNAEVRRAALHGLDELGDCNCTEVLTHALDDPAESNRRLAAIILKRVNSGKLCPGE